MKKEFAHWTVLLKEYLKRDRILILIWVLGLGCFAGGFLPFFVEIGKGSGLIALYQTMGNPAMVSLCGPTPVRSALDYTVGAMYGHLMLLFSGLIAMLLAAIHVSLHTRKEEESGLTEFICSYQVGRHASSVALLAEEVLIHVLTALFTGVLMTAFRVDTAPAGPSFLFAACVGVAGIMGAAIALFTAQIMPTSAGATGSSLGIIGLLYLLRAATDISNEKLSVLNPMGWIYRTFPFVENNALPLLFAVLFCAAVVLLAFALERGRDMGSGYLPERAGRKRVSPLLLSIPGLLVRLNRGVILGWVVTFAVLGATYGSIYGDMDAFLSGNELIRMMFTISGVAAESAFSSTILVVLGGLTAIVPIVLINRLFSEETGGRLAQLSAAKVTRASLYWHTVLLAVVSAAIALAAASAGLGGAAVSVLPACSLSFADFLAAGMNYLPAVLFFASLAALALGWRPALGKAVYGYLAYCIALNYFQGLLQLPGWLSKTAVLSWIPRMPVDAFDPAAAAGITAAGAALLVLGCVGYCRRDMCERN